MTQPSMKIAVAGATGRVGHHVVDVLKGRGHEIVAISRSHGIDLVTGSGLAAALDGVECIVDASSGESPEESEATEFFTTSMRNLHEIGARAGVERLVIVSIIGTDRFVAGYGPAKVAHERAALAGPIPARVLRASQFHEFVGTLVAWSSRNDVVIVPEMQTQLVAARRVAEALADLATDPSAVPQPKGEPVAEVAGPRAENLAAMAALLLARLDDHRRVEQVNDPADPNHDAYASGALLPGPHAQLVGPTFEQWLDSAAFAEWKASQS